MSGAGESALDPLFTLRPYSGAISCLKYVILSDCEAGLISG